MPIYEFTCNACQRLTSLFVRGVNSNYEAKCQYCSSTDLRRAVSRVAIGRTDQQIMDQYGMPDPSGGGDSYKDPRQIGRWVEKRFDEMGMDLPSEARQMIDAARQGEFPDPVKDL